MVAQTSDPSEEEIEAVDGRTWMSDQSSQIGELEVQRESLSKNKMAVIEEGIAHTQVQYNTHMYICINLT